MTEDRSKLVLDRELLRFNVDEFYSSNPQDEVEDFEDVSLGEES